LNAGSKQRAMNSSAKTVTIASSISIWYQSSETCRRSSQRLANGEEGKGVAGFQVRR